jgi:Lrp/AsnC family leucine-responsive transcriptional regulator
MDLYDKKILRLLIENCRYSPTDIAKTVNLSKDSVKNRIKRLEEKEIITNYSLMVDPRVLGYSIYHILLKLESLKDEKII